MTNYVKLDEEKRIEVVSQEEAENCDYIICAPVGTDTPFIDNVFDVCCKCGTMVFLRPHSPKKPLRVCLKCFSKQMSDEASL